MGKTLKALNVKVGDIIQWDDTDCTLTVNKSEGGRVYLSFPSGEVDYPIDGVEKWNLVKRGWTPWAEMPEEERKEILFGFFVENKVVEWSYSGKEKDSDSIKSTPLWSSDICYRLVDTKPEPVVEEVELVGGKHTDFGYIWEDDEGCSKYWYNYKLTFKTVEGEIDCNSVKMEKI